MNRRRSKTAKLQQLPLFLLFFCSVSPGRQREEPVAVLVFMYICA